MALCCALTDDENVTEFDAAAALACTMWCERHLRSRIKKCVMCAMSLTESRRPNVGCSRITLQQNPIKLHQISFSRNEMHRHNDGSWRMCELLSCTTTMR